MADNSFNGFTKASQEPNAPREKKVLHALERYLIEAQAAAEAEVKRNPLEYAAGLLFSAVAVTAAEYYGLNQALTALAALATSAAVAGSAIAARRHLRNKKEG